MITELAREYKKLTPIDYDEAFERCKEYFNGAEMEPGVFLDKYALKDSEGNVYEATPDDMHERLATELHRMEQKYPNPYSYDDIFNAIKNFKYIIPQGSPMAGMGNPFQFMSLSNCFVVHNPYDSYAGIMRTDEQLAFLMKRRAGVGTDISHLRPNEAPVKSAARTSTGAVSFMERYSNTTREVAQSGRRGALMITISSLHPDVERFIKIKSDKTKVTGANISVKMHDSFMEAVENGDTSYTLQFPIDVPVEDAEFVKEINPQEVWKELVKNAHADAEPGLLFWDNIIKESIPDCYADLGFETVSTNPSLRWNTKVLTKNGVKPIKWLAENSPDVEVMNIRGEWQPGEVFLSGKNKRLFKITFTNGQEVFCTGDHKWPIYNTSGNVINPQTGKLIKKRTDELERRNKIFLPQFEKPINNDSCTFTHYDGFVAGWMAGDGWVSYSNHHNTHHYGFIFSDTEKLIGDEILEYVNNLSEGREINYRQTPYETTHEFSISENNARTFFEEKLKIKHKSTGIPESVWEGSHEYVCGFVNGIFSADGYVKVKNRLSESYIVLTSSHESLVTDMQKLLSFYGIKSHIRESSSSATFPNGKDYQKDYIRYDLRINGIYVRKFADVFKLSSSHKNEELLKIYESDDSMYNTSYSVEREYLVVKTVEKTDITEDVYDITVFDDTHTFLMETGITSNCGEITLCHADSCRLLALNLWSFVKNPFTDEAEFDWDLFKEQVHLAQRLMDDIVDLELEAVDKIIAKIKHDPEPDYIKRSELELWEEIKDKASRGRRTGTGVTAVGDMLAALGIRYGSDESIDFVEKVMKFKKHAEYAESVQMAKDRGPFPMWDPEREKDNPFLLRLREEDPILYEEMMFHGRRNLALSTIAPTGTTSMMAQTTSGIENLFLPVYFRSKKVNPNDANVRVDYTDDVGDSWQEYPVFHPKFKVFLKVKGLSDEEIANLTKEEADEWVEKSPYYGATVNDVDWTNKVRLQGRVQKHIDHSISVTTNLPKGTPVEKVEEVYMASWKAGCKGVTIYVDGSRTGVLNTESKKDQGSGIVHTTAPKRPETLPCDVYHTTAKGERWTVFVGMLEGQPYEVFAVPGEHGKHKTVGKLTKVKSGRYDFENGEVVEDITAHNNDEEAALARMISTALRHGAKIDFVSEQLDKSEGSIISFAKAIARQLKKYVSEEGAERQIAASPLECPDDGQDCEIIFQEGCVSCAVHGVSKCT